MTTMTQLQLKRGDIALVLFPNSDRVSAKPRPALVVQANDLRTGLSQIVVVMISSQIMRSGHPSRVTILKSSPEGLQSGLLLDSVVMTDNLATIILSSVYRVIGSLPIDAVDIALKHTLDLN